MTHRIRRTALVLTFITGAAALMYEIAWQRCLADLLGSQARGTAVALSVFLAGLGAGYALFGRTARAAQPSRLLALCGWVEIGIGLWALLFVLLYRQLWRHVALLPGEGWAAFAAEVFAAVLLIGPPTVLMGGSLPLLSQGLAGRAPTDLAGNARLHAHIYAANTAGAFAGCLLAGFLSIPVLGLTNTILAAAALNVTAGLFLKRLGSAARHDARSEAGSAADEAEAPREVDQCHAGISLPRAGLVAFVAGYCSLSLQPVFVRLLSLSIGSSQYTFSLIVADFILLIAAGAWFFAGRRARWPLWANQTLLTGSLIVLYFVIPLWPYAFHVLRASIPSTPFHFYSYWAGTFALLTVFTALPVAAMGSMLPLLFGALRVPYAKLGVTVGRLYSINTLGCIAGALLGGCLLLTHINLDGVYRLAIFMAAASLLLVLPRPAGLRKAALPGTVAIAALLLPLAPGWDRARLSVGIFMEQTKTDLSFQGPQAFYREILAGLTLLDHRDDPDASIAVTEFREDGQVSRSISINGKPDGNTIGDRGIMSLIAHLPALLSRSSSRTAAVVGYGTGMTVGALTLYPQIDRVDAIEISSAVKDFAPYFDASNHGASRHPKTVWRLQDALRFLRSTSERYGVLVVQPSNPWMAGIERLYSAEFYQLARARLAPDGLLALWFPLPGTSKDAAVMMLSTLRRVFPSLRIFKYGVSAVVLASERPLDEDNVRLMLQRFQNPEVHMDLEAVGLPAPQYLAALEIWLPREVWPQHELHTLEHPKLAFLAGKDFFLGRSAALEEVLPRPEDWRFSLIYARRSLLNHLLRLNSGPLDLPGLMQIACGSRNVSLVEPNWRFVRTVCRDAVVALIAEGKAKAPAMLSPEFEWLQKFQRGEPTAAVINRNAAQAGAEIGMFSQFDSILQPLPAKRLTWNASLCFTAKNEESFNCRRYLVRALSYTGNIDAARQQLDLLKRDYGDSISTEQWQDLAEHVEQAREFAANY